MGLKKTIEQDTGIKITYFNISRMDFYPLEGIIDILVNGYVSETARRNGKSPAWNWGTRFNIDMVNPTRADIYGLLKTLPEFTGAQDDL